MVYADIREHATVVQQLTIANAGVNSSPGEIKNYIAGCVEIPAAFTLTVATITWEVSVDGGQNWKRPQTQAGADIAHSAVAVSDLLPIPPEVMAFELFRVVAGSAQAAQRLLNVYLKS